jgi:hypothetical protein
VISDDAKAAKKPSPLHFLVQNGTISEITRPLDRFFVVTVVLL